MYTVGAAWDRRDGSVFVAPLVAATLARFGAMTAPTGEEVLTGYL
jgi:hypothetical protein